MKTIIKQNTRVNDSIKKAVLDQLMLIFSSIKKIELAVEKQSDRFTPPAVHPIHTASHMYSVGNFSTTKNANLIHVKLFATRYFDDNF